METKKCSKCGIIKEVCEFRKSSKSKLGIQSECKNCAKKRYEMNREENLLKKRLYGEKNKEKKSEYDKLYRKKNRLKKNKYIREYRKKRRKEDPTFRLIESIRARLKIFYKSKNINKENKTFEIVGLTPEKLKDYLTEKFEEGMSWDNYGEWHIDHIIPLSSTTSNEELIELCHFTNLQPLWASDNLKKSNKIKKL
jgi:hypothetical protein